MRIVNLPFGGIIVIDDDVNPVEDVEYEDLSDTNIDNKEETPIEDITDIEDVN